MHTYIFECLYILYSDVHNARHVSLTKMLGTLLLFMLND